jgi:hypothetical protein
MTAAKSSGDLEEAEAKVNAFALILYGIRIGWLERRRRGGVGKSGGNEVTK